MSPLTVEDWMNFENFSNEERSWNMMMQKVAAFHSKFDFENPVNKGHDMGFLKKFMMENAGAAAAVSYTHLTLPTKRIV